MAKFSLLAPRSRGQASPNTANYAGGRAFKPTAKLEFVSVLLTTFLEDEFYRTEQQTTEKIRELMVQVGDPRFVAKAALYARNTHGMRSVSHLVAGELAKSVKGERWTKAFYAQVARRPDDVMETLGYYLSVYGRPVPNSLKKGLGTALAQFDEYQIAKYRREHGAFKLVDAVNLVRPPATPALSKLVRGELAPAETWETKLTQAGEAGSAEGVAAAKSQAWSELLRARKLGYLALLRNVRNILTQAPELVDELSQQLADEAAVRRSLVFPFQFLSAVDVLKQGNLPGAARVLEALNQAIDHSLANVPVFGGNTLVALDSSGSMAGRPQAIGTLFATTLVKTTGADLMLFSDDARYLTLNRRDSTLTAAQSIPFLSAGTNFNAIFERANRAYDRIVVLSDMQGWIGGGAPMQSFGDYKTRYGVTPRIFSFDLKGYGTLQFPQERVYCLAGWSDRVFEIMQKLDRDPEALVRDVENVLLPD
jgi:60 kDa SS-A/Ro ribonucleoprotein